MPLERIGAFAEYVAVEEAALAKMPAGYAFDVAAAVPLTGLTAWQGLVEVLEAHPGQTLLIPGGSGSFGQMAVPIARALGLRVLVTGNDRARERFLAMGVERYMDYRRENYWEKLSGIDLVIDTVKRLPQLGNRGAFLIQLMKDKLVEHRQYITAYGQDMPEILDWKWHLPQA